MQTGPIPEIWLLTGTPSAAATEMARALAQRLDRAAHIEGDALWQQIVAGRETVRDDAEGEAERQYELVIRNQCLLSRSYAEAGFVPVLDFLVTTTHHLDAYRNYLMGGRLRLVVIGDRPDELAGLGLQLDDADDASAGAILERRDEALLR